MSDSGKAAAAERGGGRGFAWAAVSLAALHAILGLLLYEPTLFTGGDNAGYLILGEALRTGQGYRDLYLPGAPLHAKYPPVFPGLLAVLGAVGGVQFLKLAMLAFTSAVVWLTARLGRALAGEGVALVAAGLLAVNPTLLDYSHYLLSEGPFLFFVSLSLWSATREGRGWQVAAVGAAVAAFGTRTAGLTLLLALPAAWALAGRRRQAMVAAAAGVAVMLAWGVSARTRAEGPLRSGRRQRRCAGARRPRGGEPLGVRQRRRAADALGRRR